MAITRKPKPPSKAKPPRDADVERLIRKGGTVPTGGEKERALSVQLRVPRSLLERIDSARTARTVPPSRHSWLLEAIHEKLELDDA